MLQENNRTEFKAELNDKLEKEVVAFLNNREGGVLYIGLDDDGKPVGVPDLDGTQLKIADRIKNNIIPSTLGLFDKVAKYAGTDKVDLIENEEYGYCSLIKATNQVMEKLKIENSTMAEVTSTKRIEKNLVAPIPMREAVINAIVHSDFSREIPPVFEIFSDRMVFTSYGGLIPGQSKQDFENEFISLTDIAKYKSDDPAAVIQNWMRNRDVIEFLGLWERLHNMDFNPLEFEGVKKQAGANAFTMSPKKWIQATNAIGIVSKAGRYGGTYAHSDMAMSFATWISPEFQLYIMKDYRRLKTDENSRLSLNWNLNREISKLNYRIHTDAIKENLIPPELTAQQVAYKYANEADMLNVVLFGKTAKQWRDENPNEKGNMRDMATINQLLVLANLESYNAILINQGKTQEERMKLLRQLVLQQLQTLDSLNMNSLPKLER